MRVGTCLSHEQNGDSEADNGNDNPKIEGLGAQRAVRGDVARDPRHHPHGEVARELVQPKGEAPALWSNQIDLHDDGHRPRHRLIGAEQHVGKVDPPPRWCVDDQERYGQSEEPADDQDRLAADAVRRPGRDQVDHRLRHPEAHDERRDGRLRAETELLLAQEWQHRPLQAYHRADEGVQDDEERELREVLPQSEPQFAHSPLRLRRRFSAKASGCGGRSARTNSTNSDFEVRRSAGLKRRSKPIVDPGFPLSPLPHAAPPKCAGKTSTWSGSFKSLPWRLSWSSSANAVSEPAPMRSGRPTPPEKRVSPVRTNQGSGARVLSVTRMETLSGVCPGVWRIESDTLPSSCRSPSPTST